MGSDVYTDERFGDIEIDKWDNNFYECMVEEYQLPDNNFIHMLIFIEILGELSINDELKKRLEHLYNIVDNINELDKLAKEIFAKNQNSEFNTEMTIGITNDNNELVEETFVNTHNIELNLNELNISGIHYFTDSDDTPDILKNQRFELVYDLSNDFEFEYAGIYFDENNIPLDLVDFNNY